MHDKFDDKGTIMKRIGFLLPVFFLFLLSTPALSYEITITGDISLKDKISGISINPLTGKAAVISEESKSLYIVDVPSRAILQKIPVAITPTGVAADVKRNSAIISYMDGSFDFFDLDTGSLIKTVSIKSHSELVSESISAIAINPKSDAVYIGNNNTLILMDLETEDIIKEISLPYTPTGLALDSNLGYLLILTTSDPSHQQSKLYIYNAETLEPTTSGIIDQASGIGYSGVAVNPSSHIAVLTNNSDNSISILSLEGNAWAGLALPDIYNIALPDFYNIETGLALPRSVSIDPLSNLALISHKDGIAIVKLENPVPMINLLIPDSARTGDSGFMLSIEGSKFMTDTQAQFNRKNVPTYFLTNEKLQAGISAEELSGAGDVPVTVTNPPLGGGTSNTFPFRIYNPAPVLESISPEIIYKPSAISYQPIALRVTGKNFFNGSKVNLNGENLKTKFISSILLEAEINPSAISYKPSAISYQRRYMVVVINPSPGAFTSNPLYLSVVEASAQASGIGSQTSDSRLQTQDSGNQNKTALKGRILNTNRKPIEGVTIQIKNIKAVTDAEGYFILENVSSGKQHVMIHGSTAKEPDSHYPTIPLTINIEPDKINDMPFQIYLHRQKNRNFKDINPAEDTVLTDPEVPGFEMRIPKGVNITGWDGKPNLKVSVRTVPTDRLPVKPLPDNSYVRTIYMFYFDKVGGGIPDEPIPVKMPNDLGLLPGEKAILWYYDESPNEGEAPNDWSIAGTGTVTPDGRYIVSDPGVGVPKFCCGATGPGCGGTCPPGPGPDCPK